MTARGSRRGAGPAPGTVRVRTACPLDCPDGCSLAVTVEDGRLIAVDAVPAGAPDTNPFTQGFICAKVRRHAERVHGPHRLRTPLVRTGPKGRGELRPASWDEALDRVADAIRSAIAVSGPASVVPYLYSSSAGELGAGPLGPLLWEALGTSTVAPTICAATAAEAWELVLGDRPGTDLATIVDADLVVVWGANPSASNTHLPPLIRQARARGAALVVIDPRFTPLAGQADVHLAVRPGTDVVLALALAAGLAARDAVDVGSGVQVVGLDEHLAAAAAWTIEGAAEVCDVEAAVIERALDLLVGARRPFFRLGWGLERNRNGGAAHRAALALAVLAGALAADGSGGGVHVHTGLGAGLDEEALAHAVLGPAGSPGDLRRAPAGPVRNMNHLGRWLADTDEDPVRVLFVQGANPAVTAPAQVQVRAGLRREDLFTVVHDQVLTDTARWADVVLPATTHFETADVLAPYGARWVEVVEPVIDRVGESHTNDEVTAALAVRLGFPADRFDPDPAVVLRRARGRGAATERPGATAAGFEHGQEAIRTGPLPVVPDPAPIVRLVADRAGVDRVPQYRPAPGDGDGAHERRPLVLVSPASARTINSIFGERLDRDPQVHLHPDDAAARGLADGDRVLVVNDQARVAAALRVDPLTRPGVAVMSKGRWLPDDPDGPPGARGLGVNALVPDALADLAGGATFNDARVDVVADATGPDQAPVRDRPRTP